MIDLDLPDIEKSLLDYKAKDYKHYGMEIDDFLSLIKRAQSAESELTTLRAELDKKTRLLDVVKADRENLDASCQALIVECDGLKLELDKLKQQKPFAFSASSRGHIAVFLTREQAEKYKERVGGVTINPVYAHPVPPQQKPDYIYRDGTLNYQNQKAWEVLVGRHDDGLELFLSAPVPPQQVPDIEKILGKLNHVLRKQCMTAEAQRDELLAALKRWTENYDDNPTDDNLQSVSLDLIAKCEKP